jgi:hypothetical protein
MANLTAVQVEADINLLIDSFDGKDRLIPSPPTLLKKSSVIPLLTIFLSFLSTIVFYFSSDWNEKTGAGFLHFFLTEGWVVVAPAAIIGVIFMLFTYSKLMMYFTVPENVRNKSIILKHLQRVTGRVIKSFIFMMMFSVILAGFSPWFTFAIPSLLFVMIFAVSLIVGAEINRLSIGLALEKISKLIKKI